MTQPYNPVKLNKEQISEMVVLYENGTYTQAELATKFGISIPTVNKILNVKGAKKGIAGPELVNRIKEKIDKEINEEQEKHNQDVKMAKQESALWPRIVGTCIIKAVADLNKTKNAHEVDEIQQKIKILKDASVGLTNSMNQRWKALGIDTDIDTEEIPELVIEDLTQEKIEEMHRKSRMSQEETPSINTDIDLNNLNLDMDLNNETEI